MQQEGVLDLMCPNHGEKIISVQLTENGENQMFCLKCFTQKQIPIEQLAQQLTDLRSKKIKNLIDQGRISEKRLGSLKKLFITIKEQFNTLIDNIIKNINDGIHQMNQNIKEEIQLLRQPIQQLNITQFNNNIEELKKQQQLNDDLFIKNDEQLRNKIIKEYLEIIKQLNQQIKQGSDWNKISNLENKINVVDQNTKIENIKIQVNKEQLNEYKLLNKEKGISICFAMTMDKDQKILINGKSNNIQILDFNQDGTLKLKQTLNGHTNFIQSLCFGLRENWFISGSWDNSMRIWKKQKDEQWNCQQILEEAHQHWVTDIVINNDEDQFISCSPDETIKVWMKELDGIKWKCLQTLTEHTYQVRFLSLNPECNLLASSGADRLRIWQKDKDQIWKQKQVIDDPNNDKHLRIKFIDNNELIASTRYQGRIIRYTLNNNGIFQLQSELKLNEIEEEEICGFPIIYNQQYGLIILRHSKDFTYILKRNDNDEFIIHQVLNGDYQAGYMIKDGKYLVLGNYNTDSLDILK